MELKSTSRRISYFMIGFLIGWFFEYTILTRFNWSPSVEKGLRHTISTYSGLMFLFSRDYRCVSLLCLPTFFAKNGRRIIVTLIISFIMTGPFTNIGDNARNAARTASCHAEKFVEEVRQLTWLRLTPMKMFMEQMQAKQKTIQEEGKKLQAHAFGIDLNHIKKVTDKKKAWKKKKLTNKNLTLEERKIIMETDTSFDPEEDFLQDKAQLFNSTLVLANAEEGGNLTCKDVMRGIENRGNCGFGKRLCDPNSRQAFYDQTGDEGRDFCDKEEERMICPYLREDILDIVCSDNIPVATNIPHIKKYMNYAKDLKKTFDSKTSFNYSYKIEKPRWSVGKQVLDRINALIKRRKLFVEAVREAWNNFIAILLVLTLWNSYRYRIKYLKDLTNDNVYITDYFEHIEERRRRAGKMTILPLKELDQRKDIIYPFKKKLNPTEKSRMITSCFLWSVFVIVVALLLYFDHILSYILDSYQRHARLTRHQFGFHELKYTVKGVGSVAEAMRKILDDIVIRIDLNKFDFFEQCLPQFYYTSVEDYWTIFGYLLLWLLLNFTDAYMLRIRRVVCQRFYPTQEKHRILHLYNKILSTRKKVITHRLKRALRERRNRIPGLEDGHRSNNILCRLCNERPINKVVCSYCETCYCKQCWDFITRVCLVCSTWEELESRLERGHQRHLIQDSSR